MRQKTLKILTSVMLIITLTMANFMLLCVNAVSYASDIIGENSNTNHKNVEFMAYLKNEKGEEVKELDTFSNFENLRLYFRFRVNKEGYFNGTIAIEKSNFNLKSEILSDTVSKIEGNKIYLNQINAGDIKEVEVGIEIIKDEKFDIDLIDMKSQISLTGVYRDSTQKDIKISTQRELRLKLVNPYEDNLANLSQEVITNKVLNYNGTDKRIVQVKVMSGIYNNMFPIKETLLNIKAPKILDKYPETVLVSSDDSLVSSGKMLTEENWNYNYENGLINIHIDNEKVDNKISWVKEGQDKIILTYIFDEISEVETQKLNSDLQIRLYDENNSVLEASNEIELNNQEKDSIVSIEINQLESNIFKGKLYAGINKEFTHNTLINVNLENVVNEINIVEDFQTIKAENSSKQLNSTYKTTKVSKSNIEDILGKNGILNISNALTGEVIAIINKDTQSDESGMIVINYPENVSTIRISTTVPETIGKIEVQSTKIVTGIDIDTVKQARNIEIKTHGKYISNSGETNINEQVSSVNLIETETSARLETNKEELSTMNSNNVEFRVVLETKSEQNELFKNPIIRIELPEKITGIKVNSINLLYENELKVKSAVLKGNVIEVILEGQQTTYKEEAIEGATLIIDTTLETNTKLPNSVETVKLTYTNENVVNYKDNLQIGKQEKEMKIVSYAGIVTTNQISDYGIDVVNNEGNKTAKLEVGKDNKNVKIDKKIINNKENKIYNVRVLGVFPTKDAIKDTNNIDVSVVSELNISVGNKDKIKVYYSNNANATEDLQDSNNGWTETIQDIKNVKKYLVIIDEMDISEEIDLSYEIQIPQNLEYNEGTQEGYDVFYIDSHTNIEGSIKLDRLYLGTGKGATIETTVKAFVGGQETTNVKQGQIIRYGVTIANTGTEDMTNVKAIGKIPEGTVYFELNKLDTGMSAEDTDYNPYILDESKKEVEFDIDKLAQGESITRYYQVKVKDGVEGYKIENIVTTKYGEVTKTTELVNTLQDSNVEVVLRASDDEGTVNSGYTYRYVIDVKNKSSQTLKNVDVEVLSNTPYNIQNIEYYKNGETAVSGQNGTIIIDSIEAGETVEIYVQALIDTFLDSEQKEINVMAKVTNNKDVYYTNDINLIATSARLNLDVTSQNSGNYVKSGDVITYKIDTKNSGTNSITDLGVSTNISKYVSIESVSKDGRELGKEEYDVESSYGNIGETVKLNNTLEPGQSSEYLIKAVVNNIPGNTEAKEISSDVNFIANDGLILKSENIKHILEPVSDGNSENPGDNSDTEDPGNTDNEVTRVITGTAWLDENRNGQKDNNEELLSGITVKLLDTSNNTLVKDLDGNEITSVTNNEGFYSLNKVPKGEYLVIFQYDSTKYMLTSYMKSGVNEDANSKVVAKTLTIDGNEIIAGATEIIKIDSENVANINIGLQEAQIFDLRLDKTVSKIVIQNSKGTVTKEYKDEKVAKAEIDAKLVNGTTAVVEYNIKVTNEGEVDAYVKKIVDYLSTGYKFSSELNKQWYQDGNNIYNSSLANEKIRPGESKEVKLVVTKQMTENNTGLVTNIAEIAESYNELGLLDVDSTPGNNVKGEDDTSSADVILSIKTGQVVTTVALVISTVLIVSAGAYIVTKIILRRKIL